MEENRFKNNKKLLEKAGILRLNTGYKEREWCTIIEL